jgi:hypothetical protein
MPHSEHIGGEPFESTALYDLVAGLRVRVYEDLLSPHWSVPDRPAARERLDANRFVQHDASSLSHVIVSLPASARSDGGEELGTATRATALIVLGDLSDRAIPAQRARTIEPVLEPAQGPFALGQRIRRTLDAWWRRLGAIFSRRR